LNIASKIKVKMVSCPLELLISMNLLLKEIKIVATMMDPINGRFYLAFS
jgi:hypothetical protein